MTANLPSFIEFPNSYNQSAEADRIYILSLVSVLDLKELV